MVKPNPIIEMVVRIHAISVLSAAMMVRWRARSVRSSARTVPLFFGAVSTRLIGPLLRSAGFWSQTSTVNFRRQYGLLVLLTPYVSFERDAWSARAESGTARSPR